jgi:flagellar protein FliO/FliZ
MDTVALVGRLLVSLAAVLGVMWLLARRMRKGGRMKDSRLIDVLGRQQLSRNASVAVVRVGDQALVIGVTDTQVSVLGDTDLGAAQAMVAAPQNTSPKRAVPLRAASGRHAGSTPDAEELTAARKPLAGSALSPQTWRQAVESLRDMTSRPA